MQNPTYRKRNTKRPRPPGERQRSFRGLSGEGLGQGGQCGGQIFQAVVAQDDHLGAPPGKEHLPGILHRVVDQGGLVQAGLVHPEELVAPRLVLQLIGIPVVVLLLDQRPEEGFRQEGQGEPVVGEAEGGGIGPAVIRPVPAGDLAALLDLILGGGEEGPRRLYVIFHVPV